MRIFIKTLGCRSNKYESEKLIDQLASRSHSIVADPEDADVVIVNTCTVTHVADRKSRQEIYPYLDKKVIVFGCGPRISENAYQIDGVDLVAQDPAEILEFLGDGESGGIDNVLVARANLKIQDGCENYCTYCVIPFARGKCESKPYDEVLYDASRLIIGGSKELVLTGINIGEWQDNGMDFWDLMLILLAELPARIRISSLEPFVFDERVAEVLSHPNCCRHLHICAQSGCDSVLKRMGRNYSASDFKKLIADIRDASPDIAVTTDIITGFPSETDVEHKQTLELLSDINFAKIHTFRYSKRDGTPAAKAKNQIPYAIKVERSREIRDLSDKMRRSYQEKFVGSTQSVLFEHQKDDVWVGTTDNYLQVEVVSKSKLRYELKNVRLGMLKSSGRFKGRILG